MTANTIATTATDKIARMTTAQLLDAWREIDAKPMTPEVAIVRGWLMDALEARNPEAFAAWLEQYDMDDPTPLYLPHTLPVLCLSNAKVGNYYRWCDGWQRLTRVYRITEEYAKENELCYLNRATAVTSFGDAHDFALPD